MCSWNEMRAAFPENPVSAGHWEGPKGPTDGPAHGVFCAIFWWFFLELSENEAILIFLKPGA